MWPNLSFSELRVAGNEIFFMTSQEVENVVVQGNATRVIAKLPGLFTNLILCFPVPSLVRVYLEIIGSNGRRMAYFLGEGGGRHFYRVSQKIKYRYTLEFPPWMYKGYLKTGGVLKEKTRIVNYIIKNCGSGHAGILLKFRDEYEASQREKEWLKVLWFDTGNDFLFWQKQEQANFKEIVKLLPVKNGNFLHWLPESPKQFKRINKVPGKTC